MTLREWDFAAAWDDLVRNLDRAAIQARDDHLLFRVHQRAIERSILDAFQRRIDALVLFS